MFEVWECGIVCYDLIKMGVICLLFKGDKIGDYICNFGKGYWLVGVNGVELCLIFRNICNVGGNLILCVVVWVEEVEVYCLIDFVFGIVIGYFICW